MPFEIVRNDIVNMQVDAIVNTANPKPEIGYGVDAGIHHKAGAKLLQARRRIGDIAVGDAAVTPGFDLDAKFVIHAVSPVWQGGIHNEEALLRQCYLRALELARKRWCRSIAFPLMSAGNHGFPKPLAMQIAIRAIADFLMEHEMQVYLVVFSRDACQLSEKLFQNISSFIDENYVKEQNLLQYGVADKCSVRGLQQDAILQQQMQLRRKEVLDASPAEHTSPMAMPTETAGKPKHEPGANTFPAPQAESRKQMARSPRKAAPVPFSLSLKEMLQKTDVGFSQRLLQLIDESGKKDSEIYTKANISRQHFSKIRNNRSYKPTKATAIAFAIALELDMEQTRDLIGRAGYALTMSSKFDVIIMYFISRGNYDLFEINAALFEFDQALLGGNA